MHTRILVILVIWMLGGTGTARAWWNTDWKERMVLSFHNDSLTIATDTITILIRLTGSGADSNFDYSRVQLDGDDLRFIDEDDLTELDYEIEQWDPTGISCIWVQVHDIRPGTQGRDSIFFYFDNDTVAAGQRPEHTWDMYYEGVYHLNETSGTTSYDATRFNRHGTNKTDEPGGDGPNSVATPLGHGRQFTAAPAQNGSPYTGGDYIDLGKWDMSDKTRGITLEAWVRLDSKYGSFDHRIISKCDELMGAPGPLNGAGHTFMLSTYKGSDGKPHPRIRFETENGLVTQTSTGPLINDDGATWYYVVGKYDRVVGRQYMYLDGVVHTAADSANLTGDLLFEPDASVFIGANPPDRYYPWSGVIDEVRVSNTARSHGWIKAQFLFVNNPGSIYRQVIPPALSHFTITTSAVSAVKGNPVTVTVTAIADDSTIMTSYIEPLTLSVLNTSAGSGFSFGGGSITDNGNGSGSLSAAAWNNGAATFTITGNVIYDTVAVQVDDGAVQETSRDLHWTGLTSFDVTADTATAAAGSPITITVTARSGDGSIYTGYSSSLTLTVQNADNNSAFLFSGTGIGANDFGPTAAMSGGTWTNGRYQFTVTYSTAYDYVNVQVREPGGITGVVNNLQWTSASAVDRIELTPPTYTVTAGVTFTTNPKVRVLDAYDNEKRDFTGTVTFSSSDGSASLPSAYTFRSTDEGVHEFPGSQFRLSSAGSRTITATSAGKSDVMTVTVNPAGIADITVTGMPAASTAGSAFPDITITALDGFGNIITGYTGSVTFTATDASAHPDNTFPYTTTFTSGTAVPGSNLVLVTSQTTTVTVTAGTIQKTFTITVGEAALNALFIEPTLTGPRQGQSIGNTSVPTDGTLPMHVSAYDKYGNYINDPSASWSQMSGGTLVPGAAFPSGAASYTFAPDATSKGTSGRIIATYNGTSDTTGTITITATPIKIVIRTRDSGPLGMYELGDTVITTDRQLTLYAAAFDAADNFTGNVSVAWTSTAAAGSFDYSVGSASSFTIDPSVPGSGTLTISYNALTDQSGTVTIAPGALASVRINGAAGNAAEMAGQAITTDDRLTLYAAGYDAEGNFIGNLTGVTWTVAGLAGNLSAATGSTVVYDATTPGAGTIRMELTSNTAVSDEVGVSVANGALASVVIEDNANREVGTVNLKVQEPITLNARGYDADGNLLGDQNVTWTAMPLGGTFDLSGVPVTTGIPGITFASDYDGTGRIIATHDPGGTPTADTTGIISVAGQAVTFVLTLVDQSGTPVTPQGTVTTGTMFGVEMTAVNLLGDPAPSYAGDKNLALTWTGALHDSASGRTGIKPADSVYYFTDGKTVLPGFTLYANGTVTLTISDVDDTLKGVLTITTRDGIRPVMEYGYAMDVTGNGYYDTFILHFNEALSDATAAGANGVAITSVKSIPVNGLSINGSAGMVIVNGGILEAERDGGMIDQDIGELPAISYSGTVITDAQGNNALIPAGTVLRDSAGPVLAAAEYRNMDTEGNTSDDVMMLILCEPIDITMVHETDSAGTYVTIKRYGRTGAGNMFGTGAYVRVLNTTALEVHMGDHGTEVLTGLDSVCLVPGSCTDMADGRNPVPDPNHYVVINRPRGSVLIEGLVSFPNPLRATHSRQSGMLNDSLAVDYGANIKYVLNRNATTDLRIFTLLGVPVYRTGAGSGDAGGRQGVNIFYWNGTNQRQRFVESGAYILVLKAIAADGTYDTERVKIGVAGR